MALLKTAENVKSHVSLAFNFTWAIIAPYAVQAERKYIVPAIGDTQYGTFDAVPADGNPLVAYKLLQEAAANFTIFKYLPIASLHISDAGVYVNSGPDYKAPEWWQQNDLARTLLEHGYEALDAALKVMEENANDFPGWTASNNYTVYKELFITRAGIFNRYYNISESRRTFTALRPLLLEVQTQYFSWLNENTRALIIAAGNTATKTALEYARASQASYTVSKAAMSGMFLMTSGGLFLKTTEVKGDKVQTISPEMRENLIRTRQVAGDEFVKKLKTHIETNAASFPDYTVPSASEVTHLGVTNTKSIVGF